MNISLAPSFHCNFRCAWCYLSVEQLRDRSLLNLDLLHKRLQTVEPVEHVDIYGGEPATLPQHYVEQLLTVLKSHTHSINVISNFSIVPDWFYRDDITISASYDWNQRQSHDKVLTNIIGFDKPIAVLMLATEQLCKEDPKVIASVLNQISTVGSLEIKPYSINQFNQHGMDWTLFENWIKVWLELDLNFEFVNRKLLDQSINKQYNAYSDNHLYIAPDGEFYVLDFDINDREYFKHIKDLASYSKWVNDEKQQVTNNKFCSKCHWQGHCATEHYRTVKSLDQSCNGFKNLLDWYAALED